MFLRHRVVMDVYMLIEHGYETAIAGRPNRAAKDPAPAAGGTHG